MKNYKQELELKYPNLDFTNFKATKSHEFGDVSCKKHGKFKNSYKELIRMIYGCRKCKPLVPTYKEGFCEKHGKYLYRRYNKNRCKKCGNLKKRDTHDDFLKKLLTVSKHIDELGVLKFKILSKYEQSNKKILIEDNFGQLLVTPNHLLMGRIPGIDSAIDKTTYTINQFKSIHGNYYNYSYFKYTNASTKLSIVCPIHGEFKATPVCHKRHKCKKCAYNLLDIGFTEEDFIRIANGRMCTLYLVEIVLDGEIFLKIGITSRSIKTRLYKMIYTVLASFSSINANIIFNKEKMLHNKLKQYKFIPKTIFNGYQECYNIKHKKEVEYEFTTI